MTYRYLVLGPTRVLRPDGAETGLGGARIRALLAALAAGGGRPVAAGALTARIWHTDEGRPADETAALQALVGRLRRTIGPQAVELTPGGYRLAADQDDIDLFRFEKLTLRGTAALEAERPAEAAVLLDEGLALWRGPALADLPDRQTDPLVIRAEQRRSEARRGRIAAEVALGRASGVLTELTALAAETPLDEPLQALRIRALAASGRPAQALQAYEETRTALVERLGTDPGAELRSLHAGLLAGARPPLPAPAPAPAPARGNLRARLTSFIGRERELADLATVLRTHRLVTLIGPGGAGKTRLALESAEQLARHAPDGVWAAELAPVRDAETLPEAVLTALGGREPQLRAVERHGDDPLVRLVEHCARRRMLLVLDNCEHVVEAAAALAERLLEHCPGLTVLATSREPLNVPGELVRPLDPLPAPTALRLFAERGAAARPGFHTDDDPDACAEICRRLDGLPLAIELAAARLRLLTPRQIADRLDDRFRLLTTGSRTALPRQQTLRAVVDWSWDLLEPTERTVLRRLSVFTGGCALAQAEAVCGPDTLGALAALVDKSLVVAAPDGPDGMRYRLLETVAEYAAARLDEAGERTAAERRHLAVYRELLRGGDAELRGPRQAEWTARFETEHDNARTALRTAVRLRDEQEGLCLVLSMSWFWQQRGDQADARVWASATGALGPDPFAAPLRPAGPLPGRCTDTPPPWSGERLWEARRGVRLIMLASAGVEDTALDGRWEGEPQDYLRRIVAAYRPGLPQLRGQPGSMWFFARLMTGGLNGLAETADAMVAACDDPDGDGDGGWELAFALLMRARLRPGAGDDADRALALFDRTGDLWGYAEALSARGEAHEREGRYEEAAADYEGALRGAARVGAHRQLPVFKARLAFLRLRTAADDQERAQAERRLLDVVEASDGHTVEVVGTGRMLLVRHYGATGRTGPARGQLALMERELHETAPGLFRGLLTGLDAWLDCLDGRWDRARAGVRAALGHLDSLAYLISPQLIADQFLCAAWALAHPADTAGDGARLLGAYDAVERHPGGLGFQPFDDEREVRLSAERDLRAALGDRAYEQAYEEGRGLALRDAAALI